MPGGQIIVTLSLHFPIIVNPLKLVNNSFTLVICIFQPVIFVSDSDATARMNQKLPEALFVFEHP